MKLLMIKSLYCIFPFLLFSCALTNGSVFLTRAEEKAVSEIEKNTKVKITERELKKITKRMIINGRFDCPHKNAKLNGTVELDIRMQFHFQNNELKNLNGEIRGSVRSKDSRPNEIRGVIKFENGNAAAHLTLIDENRNEFKYHGRLDSFNDSFQYTAYDEKNIEHKFVPLKQPVHSHNKSEIYESYEIEYSFRLAPAISDDSDKPVNKNESKKNSVTESFLFTGTAMLNELQDAEKKELNKFVSAGLSKISEIPKLFYSENAKNIDQRMKSISFQGTAIGTLGIEKEIRRFVSSGMLKTHSEEDAKFISSKSFTMDISETGRQLNGAYSEKNNMKDPAHIKKGDSVTVFFDSAYLKYLPDLWHTNEAVIIFTFEESGGLTDRDNKTYKILGPMDNFGDNSLASYLGMVVYGPKIFTGDKITVSIQVIELDKKDKENRKKFISFFTSAAEKFSLANPVTQVEIQMAAQIAQTFNSFDEDDKVLNFTFELLPSDFQRIAKHEAIPLRTGNYALIKQEKIRFLDRYYHYTRSNISELKNDTPADFWDIASYTPVIFISLLADTALLLPQVILNPFRDVPDGASAAEMNFRDKTGRNSICEKNHSFEECSKSIYFDDSTKFLFSSKESSLYNKRIYDSKTWITFSIEKGREPTTIERQVELSRTEKEILKVLKEADGVEEEDYLEKLTSLSKSLEKAKKEERERKLKDRKDKENDLKNLLNTIQK